MYIKDKNKARVIYLGVVDKCVGDNRRISSNVVLVIMPTRPVLIIVENTISLSEA